MEMTVARGRGYSPAEERGKLPLAEIPVDAIFSPVRKVNFRVERARLGQVSDLDRLILEVWTDSTLLPAKAVSTAAQIVVRYLMVVAEFGDVAVPLASGLEESRIPARIADVNIEDLDLSVRA